jgi:WD40 repeat protein
LSAGNRSEITGIVSAGDIRWISNSKFVYRSGGAGDYSVRIYDVSRGGSSLLISGTMNPDINFSERAGLITCLENQIINIFSADLKNRIETGIEGEETSFSPDGRKLISIYRGKLYVTSLTMLKNPDRDRVEMPQNLLESFTGKVTRIKKRLELCLHSMKTSRKKYPHMINLL